MRRSAAAYSEACVSADQGVPDRIIEGVRGHDQFRPEVIGTAWHETTSLFSPELDSVLSLADP